MQSMQFKRAIIAKVLATVSATKSRTQTIPLIVVRLVRSVGCCLSSAALASWPNATHDTAIRHVFGSFLCSICTRPNHNKQTTGENGGALCLCPRTDGFGWRCDALRFNYHLPAHSPSSPTFAVLTAHCDGKFEHNFSITSI